MLRLLLNTKKKLFERILQILFSLLRIQKQPLEYILQAHLWRYWKQCSKWFYLASSFYSIKIIISGFNQWNFQIHLVSEHIWSEDYLVRSFYLKNLKANETRTVTQFHFLTWPKKGVPPTTKALLDFRRFANIKFFFFFKRLNWAFLLLLMCFFL